MTDENTRQFEKHIPIMVSVGAAVQDVFLSGKVFAPHIENGEKVEEFKAGEKYELEKVTFSTGGGATNAAVTFSRQGLHPIYMGKIGDDPAGKIVLDELHREGVDTTLVKTDPNVNTGYSTLLLAPTGERTVLVYRGASEHFGHDDFDLAHLHGDWLYVTSLAGNLDIIERLVEAAKAKDMKVAINPGKKELEQADRLKQVLHKVDVLTLNKEEIQQLVEGETDEQLVRHCSDMTPTTVMTDGPNGVTATDRTVIVKAGMYEDVPVIDRTGAGDAFGSGLVATLAKGKSLAEAVLFASANSTSVVGQIGAKAGILDEHTQLHDMPLEVSDF
jgi:sugar/nucleoside kinase (ribokinase family)